jgi:hypothetical protein
MLDLTQYEVSTDSPELAEYKVKVEKVARDYAKKHSWCHVINNVLRDLDIQPEKKVMLDVTTSLGFVLHHRVLPSTLIGLTDEQQRALIASQIGSLSISSISAAGVISLTADTITDLSLPTSAGNVRVGGYVENEEVQGLGTWLYASDKGRVEHFYEDMYVRDGVIVRGMEGQVRHEDYGNYRESFCAQMGSYTLRQTSTRSEGRHCQKCQDRVTRRA